MIHAAYLRRGRNASASLWNGHLERDDGKERSKEPTELGREVVLANTMISSAVNVLLEMICLSAKDRQPHSFAQRYLMRK